MFINSLGAASLRITLGPGGFCPDSEEGRSADVRFFLNFVKELFKRDQGETTANQKAPPATEVRLTSLADSFLDLPNDSLPRIQDLALQTVKIAEQRKPEETEGDEDDDDDNEKPNAVTRVVSHVLNSSLQRSLPFSY